MQKKVEKSNDLSVTFRSSDCHTPMKKSSGNIHPAAFEASLPACFAKSSVNCGRLHLL
jgi:hydrogenase maturation factor HypE